MSDLLRSIPAIPDSENFLQRGPSSHVPNYRSHLFSETIRNKSLISTGRTKHRAILSFLHDSHTSPSNHPIPCVSPVLTVSLTPNLEVVPLPSSVLSIPFPTPSPNNGLAVRAMLHPACAAVVNKLLLSSADVCSAEESPSERDFLSSSVHFLRISTISDLGQINTANAKSSIFWKSVWEESRIAYDE